MDSNLNLEANQHFGSGGKHFLGPTFSSSSTVADNFLAHGIFLQNDPIQPRKWACWCTAMLDLFFELRGHSELFA